MSIQSFTIQQWMESHEIHFGIINSNDSSTTKFHSTIYIHRGLLFSYIMDRFRIQNKYVLFNTVHIFIILNGALTGNYNNTFKPSSFPKTYKKNLHNPSPALISLNTKQFLLKGGTKVPAICLKRSLQMIKKKILKKGSWSVAAMKPSLRNDRSLSARRRPRSATKLA